MFSTKQACAGSSLGSGSLRCVREATSSKAAFAGFKEAVTPGASLLPRRFSIGT